VLQCAAMGCNEWQLVAVGCSGLQWVAVGCLPRLLRLLLRLVTTGEVERAENWR